MWSFLNLQDEVQAPRLSIQILSVLLLLPLPERSASTQENVHGHCFRSMEPRAPHSRSLPMLGEHCPLPCLSFASKSFFITTFPKCLKSQNSSTALTRESWIVVPSVTLNQTVLLGFFVHHSFPSLTSLLIFLPSFFLSSLFYFSVVLLMLFMYLFFLLIESLSSSNTKGIFYISLSL